MMADDDVLKDFLVESHENLDQLDRDFIALEADPSAPDRIGSIFRTIHTLKGSAGFLGLSRLEQLAHAGESLLSLLRDGALSLTPEMTSALLALVDRVRGILHSIEQTGSEGEVACEDVLVRLTRARGGDGPPRAASKLVFFSTAPPAAASVSRAPAPPASEPSVLAAPSIVAAPAERPSGAPPAAAGQGVSDSTVRVDVGLLDTLMNLVGELVLARNQMLQFAASVVDPGFVGASQRLNHITTELQQQVMKTRMQPIGNVWSKLPRVVRDLAISCGKQVRIEMIGKETELDRTVLEAIKDPLTHVVRNAVDHGIEALETRAALGKPRTGTLRLKAFHEGGQVNIEISDDGAGLRLDAIRSKAIERNLISAEQATRMSAHELVQLVFLPGFSTAAKLTNVSGRGVGMDVVKTNIEKIGGTIDLLSREGEGTTLRIKIPLTLAIVPALIISSGDQRYAIPQVNLLELVRLEAEFARTGVERIHGVPVYRLRGRLLPLVFLNQQLRCAGADPTTLDASGINIVVLQADDRQFGLVVDEVHDTEEIVVKPLGKELKSLAIYQGATIMGDGRVALILDILGLAQHASVLGRGRESGPSRAREQVDTSDGPREQERQALLLFAVGDSGKMALPLALVARIEEIPRARLERAGNRDVVQYRGEILPLIDLHEAIGVERCEETNDSLHVIVYTDRGRSVGFVVSGILDVVEDAARLERCTAQRGVLGATVVAGKVVDLLDVEGVIKAYQPGFFEGRAA
jgi:two-component system, chemotaxis family, sensor kinase CheA